MIKKEINFSDLVDFFKKNDAQTFDKEIDEFGGYFITAARIAAIIIAPDPISKISVFCASIDAASLRASKLFSWLPDKFKYKDREKTALQKYELSSYVNFILLQIAIKNGVKEIIMPHLQTVLKNIELSEEDKNELEKKSTECDKERITLNLPNNCALSKEDISNQAIKIIDPIFSVLNRCIDKVKDTTQAQALKGIDSARAKETFLENVSLQYQAFLINFSSEFPEFALWADVTQKEKILTELKSASKSSKGELKKLNDEFISQTEKLIEKIEELKENSFIKESGFPSFMETYDKMFKTQEEHISKVLSGRTIENINAHHEHIKNKLNKPLSDNTDVEEICYPLEKNIFISQSFEAITYRKKVHRRIFLAKRKLSEQARDVEIGENIGKFLQQTLVDPNTATKPILLLGNPGAGKSMLSRMFAGLLCETNDFIPFLIRLRDVASSSGNISEHINKGLESTIVNVTDINWLEWAKEFKERIPVVILDGFDELMQTANRELNGYVDSIKDFQEKAINSGICVRVILTSRISVMQDVFIPEETKIIKLDSFDDKRRDLWIEKWQESQKNKPHNFKIPKNEKIDQLAEEPLLLFMLAVYDFESGDLQKMAKDKNFNQSKLYDSLLERFIERQLIKYKPFKDFSESTKEKEKELFRLRLGMIALMMFLNDTTSRDSHKLLDEMNAFGINKSTIPTNNILGGFFFIHENKSTSEGEIEKFNYEFLHKTFGEFLAADFMLRVTKKQYERIFDANQEFIAKKETFYFCFGYNWLHKHNNIQKFLYEHAPQILKPTNAEVKFIISSIIKNDLKELFDKGHQAYPVTDIRLLEKKTVIEHLGIYSQNIIFLWLAIANNDNPVPFEIYDVNECISEAVNEPKYESQDRDEINKNKLLWKRLSKLWTLVGNYNATAKLAEWITVTDSGNTIELSKTKSKVIHNFSDSAYVGCNDFELLLSYFDNEYKFTDGQRTLQIIENIISKKPELFSLAVDVVLHRFHDLYSAENMNLIEWFRVKEISRKQQVALIKKTGLLKWQIDPTDFVGVVRLISEYMQPIFKDNIQATNEFLKILVDLKAYFPLTEIINPEMLEDMFHMFNKEFRRHDKDSPLSMLEYIRLLNELSKFYPFRRKFKGDFMEELLYRLSKDMRHYVMDNPSSAFEYLRLFNELRQYYPMGKMQLEFYDEALHIISKDIKHFVRNNPQIILEYLKLFYDMNKHFQINEKVPQKFIIELLRLISDEWETVFRDNQFNLLEYLKIISEFGMHYPIEEIIPQALLHDIFHRLSKDLVYIIRDNPKEAHQYLQVVKQFYSHYSSKQRFKGKMIIDEPFFRLSKEMDMEIRDNPDSTLIYLELLLINREYYQGSREAQMIDSMLNTIRKSDYSSNVLTKAAVILIQYEAPSYLIERLFNNHPKFRNLFLKSPELAIEVLKATAELNKNEKFN
ncbi:MAG: hypothetical protein HY960_04135 [Ignavibacteriae bacterium]|nr:hypothetical protein [Ignavibacteriota bacterium]